MADSVQIETGFSWDNLPAGAEFDAEVAKANQLQMAAAEGADAAQADGTETVADDADAVAEPAQTKAPAAADGGFAALLQSMQQQNLLATQAMMQQMQQQNQAFMQQMAQQFAPKQEQTQEVDPLSQLDREDPDYFFKAAELRMARLEKQNADLLAAARGEQTQRQTAAQQQQEAQQHNAFVQEVSQALTRAVEFVFNGWPDNDQTRALKEMAAHTIDAEWNHHGYKNYEGLAAGVAKAQKKLASLAVLRTGATQAPRGQRQAPVGRTSAPPVGGAPKEMRYPNDYWNSKDQTTDRDALDLRAALLRTH